MEICKLEHIKKDYRNGELVSPLVDINLTVNSGDFIAIEGPSGIGKSTLLYVMGTLLKSDGGKMSIEGVDVSTLNDDQLADLRAQKVGFLFQDSNMIQALTLRDNLLFTQKIGKKSGKPTRDVDELLERFGLDDRAHFLPGQLSGGQRRRAVAARSLIHCPSLILADEPTNDLDKFWAEEIIKILQEEAERGAAVIMVTHNTQWSQMAKRRFRFEDGKLLDME